VPHRAGHLVQARRSGDTVAWLRRDACLAVLRVAGPGQMGPKVAASREDIFASLMARHPAAVHLAPTGAKERPVAASGCSAGP
jgi:hypothetical protein